MSASKVRAHGPGLESTGNIVGELTSFTVETADAGKGTTQVSIVDPKGKQVKCDSVTNKDKKLSYTYTYLPQVVGEFKVKIYFGGKEIPKSPFTVKVKSAAPVDASKVTAKGPGLEKEGVVVDTNTYFEVDTRDAGKGVVEIVIIDPSGHTDRVKPVITPATESVFIVEYTALQAGQHSINIYFGGKPVPHSPFGVIVTPSFDAKSVYATGRGIQAHGVRVKQEAEFKVQTKGAGTSEIKVQIIGPDGVNVKCDTRSSEAKEGVYEYMFIPSKVGDYVIHVTCGGYNITESPFYIDVGPEKTSTIVAFGPGLEAGVVNQPACFTVEMNGEIGVLEFSVEGPSEAKIESEDDGEGTFDVIYWPTTPGEYAVHILCEEEDIPQSPYMVQVQPATDDYDASKVVAKGPGLEKKGVIINQWAEFYVDTRKAGRAQLYVKCVDANYNSVTVEIKDNKDGTYSCRYNPKHPVSHMITITWGTVSIPESPFRVSVTESGVAVYGPGVETDIKTFMKTYFTVDCKAVETSDVTIFLVDGRDEAVPFNVFDNEDGTFTVEYEPATVGTYTVQVYLPGKEIPVFQKTYDVDSSVDFSKETIKGLDTPIKMGDTRQIVIDTSLMPKTDASCKVAVTTPKNEQMDLVVTKSPEGYLASFTPTQTGHYDVIVIFDKKPVTESPFLIEVVPKPEMIHVKEVMAKDLIAKPDLVPAQDVTSKAEAVSTKIEDLPTSVVTYKVGPPKGEGMLSTEVIPKPVPSNADIHTTKLTPKAIPSDVENLPTSEGSPKKAESQSTREVTPKSALPNQEAPPKTKITPNAVAPKTEVLSSTEVIPETMTPKAKFLPTTDVTPPTVLPKSEALSATDVIPRTAPRKTDVLPTNELTHKAVPSKAEPLPATERTLRDVQPKAEALLTAEGTPKSNIFPTPEVLQEVLPKRDAMQPTEAFKEAELLPSVEETQPGGVVPITESSKREILVKGLETPILLGETRKVSVLAQNTDVESAAYDVTMTTSQGDRQFVQIAMKTESCDYFVTPTVSGLHKFTIEYSGKEVPNSPFTVNVEKIDVSEVVVKGLETVLGMK